MSSGDSSLARSVCCISVTHYITIIIVIVLITMVIHVVGRGKSSGSGRPRVLAQDAMVGDGVGGARRKGHSLNKHKLEPAEWPLYAGHCALQVSRVGWVKAGRQGRLGKQTGTLGISVVTARTLLTQPRLPHPPPISVWIGSTHGPSGLQGQQPPLASSLCIKCLGFQKRRWRHPE